MKSNYLLMYALSEMLQFCSTICWHIRVVCSVVCCSFFVMGVICFIGNFIWFRCLVLYSMYDCLVIPLGTSSTETWCHALLRMTA